MTFRSATGASLGWLATGGELLLVIWSIPLAILLFGIPIVLVIRLVVELAESLL